MNLENYTRLLSRDDGEQKYFTTPWGGLVFKNITSSGTLVKYASLKTLRQKNVPLWVSCQLLLFRQNQTFFQVFKCEICDCMSSVDSLSINQDQNTLERAKCLHSKTADLLLQRLGTFDTVWNINIQDYRVGDESFDVRCNFDVKQQTLIDSDKSFLAVLRNENNAGKVSISILTSVNSKTKVPFCQLCLRSKCKCFFRYKKIVEEDLNCQGSSSDDESFDMDWYWNRKKNLAKKVDHYEDVDTTKFGYNRTPFEYPIFRDEFLHDKFQEYSRNNLVIPESLIPSYSPNERCPHGNTYIEDNDQLVLKYRNITVFYESSETLLHRRVYGSSGNCKCCIQLDGHPLLLWNLGGSKFVHYSFLLNICHYWGEGQAFTSTVHARQTTLNCLNVHTSLSQQDIDRAVIGFCLLMKDKPEDFICLGECGGDTPPIIVADGVCIAPTSRKVDHIDEFKPLDEDKKLSRSTVFANRTYLTRKVERKLVEQMVEEDMPLQDFMTSDITSENGLLIRSIIERLQRSHQTCPKEYKDLFSDLSKQTSTAGHLQVNSREPLIILQDFAEENIDLRSPHNIDKLNTLQKEISPLWTSLRKILGKEKTSKYLPRDVAAIVLKIIEIRKNTFRNASQRHSTNYTPYPPNGRELPSMFYPNWRPLRYPENYEVPKSKSDACNKNYKQTKGFSFGLFTVGCACSRNITLGFELMKNKESAHNLFRLVTTRDLDLEKLKLISFDHACSLNTFALNREAREFEYIKTVVDTVHWKNHTACSRGFDSRFYKNAILQNMNSQSREQTNSKIAKLKPSLRQMNYQSFMVMVKVFFRINNLKANGILS